jgi:tetratricopeptide (TPR) repeat protein
MPTARQPPNATAAQILKFAHGLIAAGRMAEASLALRKHLYRNSRDAGARKLLASLGRAAHPAPALSPADQTARQAILAAFQAQNWPIVLAQAQPLLKRQPLLSDIANALGNALAAQGRNNDATRVFDHAIRSDPAGPDAYLSLSSLLRNQGQPTEALAAAKAALDVAPESAAVQVALGLAHLSLDATDLAETHLRRATELAPGAAPAWEALAKMLERLGRLDDLDAALTGAEAHLPDHPTILLHRAIYFGRRNLHQQTLETAAKIDTLPPRDAAALHVTRGRALHALGQYGAAFDAFTAMNAAADHFSGRGDISGPRYLARVTGHLAATPALIAPDYATDTPQPVFLVGFPRSGTTLLETILMTHPDVALIEEHPLVNILTEGLRPDHLAADLATLDDGTAQSRASAYLAAFETRFGQPLNGRIPFDKLPLNLVEAAAINRCFPNAKFVFSRRHPCDVILSCFMQNFAPNDAMENFRSLEAAAILYDRVMTLWQASAARLDLNTVTIRYEDLIADLRAAITPILDHTGLTWRDAMAQFHETTKPVIRTASYAQVRQPLYTSAAGRWRHYQPQLAPVMGWLAPWITRFGYDA